MAMADLNARAPPYHGRRSNRPHPSPFHPPPAPMMPAFHYYGSAAFPPQPRLVPNYPRATFPEHRYPLDLAPPQPQPQPSFRPHAPSPPRGLMFPNNRAGAVCEKLYAQAMYRHNSGRVGVAAVGGSRRAAACGPRAWTVRGRGRAHAPAARTGGRAARSPSPAFTTRPDGWIPPPRWFGCTTVMIRNIPTKLTRAGMMELLDDHCARENGRRRGRAAAYDFLYVPMDFSSRQPSSNRGYAFVNFTTADAARGFHFALHGCGWKPWVRGRRTLNVAAARIQGKRAAVWRFTRRTFVCDTDDFLPAVYRPPRDGANGSQPRNLGRIRLPLPPLVSPVDQPPPTVEQAQQQQPTLVPVRVDALGS